ncbi:MAG TPA: helix-turn-helix transcriptional regulator [Bacillota bacterium]|nr:helix-turn-helix transcriptional regulator [Bacillota bacterium]
MGNKIKQCRKSMGMTQAVLAEKSRVSRAIISGLESGRTTTTTTATLQKIADALEKEIGEIFFSS